MLILGHAGITLGIFWFLEERVGLKFDYRIVVLSALLPDIIDKPLGMIILPLNNGRIVGHTAIFAIALLFVGLRYRNFPTISLASMLHLVEDEMWNEPETLFWPFFGNFPKEEYKGLYEYVRMIASEYIPSPSHTFIFEVVGAFIIILFLIRHRHELQQP